METRINLGVASRSGSGLELESRPGRTEGLDQGQYQAAGVLQPHDDRMMTRLP